MWGGPVNLQFPIRFGGRYHCQISVTWGYDIRYVAVAYAFGFQTMQPAKSVVYSTTHTNRSFIQIGDTSHSYNMYLLCHLPHVWQNKITDVSN